MEPYQPRELPLSNLNWVDLISQLGKANRAIANYDGILKAIPNPSVLLAPLTTQEAVLSSKIEGTQATLGEVYRFEAGEQMDGENKRNDIKEVLNYRAALRIAEKSLNDRQLTLSLIRELHAALMESVRGQDKNPGAFRTTQNWIGLPNGKIDDAYFVPPSPFRVNEYMENWEKYYWAEEKDPLVQLAILHAQFEIVHPFDDGNGRLGRILIPLFLFERKLLSRPMFYLSGYFETHREQYVALLRAIKGDKGWENWIKFFLDAVLNQANENTLKAQSILKLYAEMKKQVLKITHSQYAIPLLDEMFKVPIFRSNILYEKKEMPSRPMINKLLRQLKEASILKTLTQGSGRRPEVLIFPALLNLCEGKEAF